MIYVLYFCITNIKIINLFIMETKEFKVPIPDGMEIDKEKSTFECIKFKPIEHKRWRDDENVGVNGYYIGNDSSIEYHDGYNRDSNYNVFATEKQAKSALAMARISQIMANDDRFGGVITDEEWNNISILKYTIERLNNGITIGDSINYYNFLAFHTAEQRDLFLEENEDLVKDFLMID